MGEETTSYSAAQRALEIAGIAAFAVLAALALARMAEGARLGDRDLHARRLGRR